MPKTKKRKTPASSNINLSSSIDHMPEAKGETMTHRRFPKELTEIMLGYLNGDINPISETNNENISLSDQYKEFKLFGRNIDELVRDEAALVGNLILQGEEKEVNQAIDLVRKNPFLLRCKVEATDPLGRRVRGTPLQIAAMAGDLDLKPGITDEKDRGIVERLVKASSLSEEEVAEQLKCVTSKEALKANETRNECILVAIKKFGNAIAEVKTDDINNLKEMQARCKPYIDQLHEELKPDTETMTTAGFIFDPAILQKAAEWFEENADKKFGGWLNNNSNVFWVNGIGKLQARLSSRDAEVVRAGIDHLLENGDAVSVRTLKNDDSSSYFFNSESELGVSFYIGSMRGEPLRYPGGVSGGAWGDVPACGFLSQTKTTALQNLCGPRQLTIRRAIA